MLPEDFFVKNKRIIILFLGGLIILGLGIIITKKSFDFSGTKVEVLNNNISAPKEVSEITIEVSGQVVRPGVYRLALGSRIEDALVAAGGISGSADRIWIEKSLNRAAKLSDGQKIYIPKGGEQSNALSARTSGGYQTTPSVSGADQGTLININTASLSALDALPGIGPVYGQNIIDHRPYSNIDELLSRGVLKKNIYEKIKDKISTY